MKKIFISLFTFPLLTVLVFLLSTTHVYADTRLEPTSYEPIPCGSNCTTLRVYYNQSPPTGEGWGLLNYNPCCGGWSGSAGPTNIHDTYADYTWNYPYNQGTDFVVLQSGDTVSSPFTIDFSITEPTTFSQFNSVAETNYQFIPCDDPYNLGKPCATVRIYYNQVPPSESWGLINWQHQTLWSGAAGPLNIHDTYADYTFYDPYIPSTHAQYSLVSSSDFSSPFTVDWSTFSINSTPSLQSFSNATLNQRDTYLTNGSFADPDSISWTANVDYGDGSGTQPLNLSGQNFSLSHQYTTVGTYTITVSITDNQGATGTGTATVTVQRQLASLSSAKVWVGLKNSDDVGVKFDLKAEVYSDNTLITSGETDSVAVGSSGFNNAKLYIINFNSFSPVNFPNGSQLAIELYVRNACSGSWHNSGVARLWYNDGQANSQFGATIGTSTSSYYLLNNLLLGSNVGIGPKEIVDVQSGAKCSTFKPFGTWTVTP